MQTLYYTSASASLLIQQDNNTSRRYDYVSNLIVCSSLQEVIAFSGSQQILTFPLAGTSIVYSDLVQQAIYAPQGLPTEISTSVVINFNLINIPAANTASCYYYISSSGFYFTGSGQTAQASFPFATNQECKIGVEGTGSYTASITLYNTSQYSNVFGVPGTVITRDTKLDSGLYVQTILTGSNNYQAEASIIGPAALP